MDSGSESSLSTAPPSSGSRAAASPSPLPPPPPPPPEPAAKVKKPTKKTSVPAFQPATGSRRSSRVAASRSNSPEKRVPEDGSQPSVSEASTSLPATAGAGVGASSGKLKVKIRRPSPPKQQETEVPSEPSAAVVPEQEEPVIDAIAPISPSKGKKGKGQKRKSSGEKGKAEVEDDVRGKMGTKRTKTSHTVSAPEEQEPVKKGTAIKRKGARREGSVDFGDLFSEDEDEQKDEGMEAGPSIAAKPPQSSLEEAEDEIKAEAAPTPTPKISIQGKKGSKSARSVKRKLTHEHEFIPPVEDQEPVEATPAERPAKSAKKKDTKSLPVPPVEEPTAQMVDEPMVVEEEPAAKTSPPAAAVKVEPKPSGSRKSKTKTFAQAVSGSPIPVSSEADPEQTSVAPSVTPATTAKPAKRPMSAIPKIAKLGNASASASPHSTPQPNEKKHTTAGPAASGSIKKAAPAPAAAAPKKVVHAPSLLESTMATLNAAKAGTSTPKKEETKGYTPKPAKVYAKGEWTDEWVLTTTEQREVLESKAEREAARARREAWRKTPVNLQEAKDAYRLDATIPRVMPPMAKEFQELGIMPLGIKTEGAPSAMVAALHAQYAAAAAATS